MSLSTIEEPNNKISSEVRESLRLIEDLKFFLATAPANWQENQVIRRYYLNHDEGFVSCVFWNNLYFITGTDIVRCIVYKFEHFGRKIIDRKKFEEGIFSDLRNLKCGTDAILELPRSEFLEFLFKNSCLRTQKKQKVFFWFNVPHDKLMADALERDLKKEKMGQNPTTISHREPAMSFKYDENKALFNQLQSHIDTQTSNSHKLKPLNLSTDDNSGKSSPEYISTTTTSNTNASTNTSNTTNSAATEDKSERTQSMDLNPAQNKNLEDEVDFPLDYFDQDGEFTDMDYINLDPNFHPGAYGNLIDDNYETMVDPAIFMQNSTANSSQLIYNDEYLIEQAQPVKTPLPVLPGTSFPPRSAKFMNFPVAMNEEYLPYQRQQSAKFQSFARQTPSQLHFPPQQIPQYYGQPYYQPEALPPYMVHEHDYWHQNNIGYSAPGDPMYQSNQPYFEQEFHPHYPVMTPMVPHQPMYKGLPSATPKQPLFNKKKRPVTYNTPTGNTTPIDKTNKSKYSSLDATAALRNTKRPRTDLSTPTL